MKHFLLFATALIAGSGHLVSGQDATHEENPALKWKSDIAKFETMDRLTQPAKNGVVFVGSSTIRLWKTDKWFPDDAIINRGFGGSDTSDTLHYLDTLVLKHQPRLIVIYAGTNDIANGKSAERVFEDHARLMKRLLKDLPETHVICISIKPTLKRWHLWPKMKLTNSLLDTLYSTHPNWQLEDVSQHFIGDNGRPRADLLSKDKLHLNEKGYEVLTSIIRPHINRVMGGVDICVAPKVSNADGTLNFFTHIRTENPNVQVEFRINDGEWNLLNPKNGTESKIWKGQIPNSLPVGVHKLSVRWLDDKARKRTSQQSFQRVE